MESICAQSSLNVRWTKFKLYLPQLSFSLLPMASLKTMKLFMQSGFSAVIGVSAKSLNSSSY